jgi:hypothetical protein
MVEQRDSYLQKFIVLHEGGAGSGRYPAGSGKGDSKSQARRAFSAFIHSGGNGASISYIGAAPTKGFMVSGAKDREDISDLDLNNRQAVFDRTKAFATKNADVLTRDGMYLGMWADKGKMYLDCSANVTSRADALEIVRTIGDKAIWDVVNQKAIDA